MGVDHNIGQVHSRFLLLLSKSTIAKATLDAFEPHAAPLFEVDLDLAFSRFQVQHESSKTVDGEQENVEFEKSSMKGTGCL